MAFIEPIGLKILAGKTVIIQDPDGCRSIKLSIDETFRYTVWKAVLCSQEIDGNPVYLMRLEDRHGARPADCIFVRPEDCDQA